MNDLVSPELESLFPARLRRHVARRGLRAGGAAGIRADDHHACERPAPIALAASTKPPVLGLYGGDDGGIPDESVEQYFAALNAVGNARSSFVIYPDAPHGFNADCRPIYRKAAADDGWKRVTEYFRQHLG
ncbi:MAG: dienelactone hydrolase family protein [Betaproteobacteria bacterium]